jgi:serine/threonine protein kinase
MKPDPASRTRSIHSGVDSIQEDHDEAHPNSEAISQPNVHRYRDLELLSTGGMGEIYQAIDRVCQRSVAIKKIRKEFQEDREVRRRFHAEAELTASLEHPGIIPIYDRGIDETGRDYYCMRLIRGQGSGTYADSINNFHEKSFSNANEQFRELQDLVRKLVSIAETIAYAHSQGVVHRDLKPSNILIGPYSETLIADWGLARRVSGFIPEDQAACNTLADPNHRDFYPQSDIPTPRIGTPGYAAPDSLEGATEDVLRVADVYSLGAILYKILNNQSARLATDHSKKNENSSIAPKLPGIESLDAIACKATEKDWTKRYSSVDAFRSDLTQWLSGEPISARPEGWQEQAIRWLSRRRSVASALATACAVTLLGGACFLFYQTQQKRIVQEQARQLQFALEDSAQLLQATQKANEVSEQRRQEAVDNLKLAEKREALSYEILGKFQSYLVANLEIYQLPAIDALKNKLAIQSKDMFDSILRDFDRDLHPTPMAITRLSQLAFSLASSAIKFNNEDQAHKIIDQACGWMQGYLDPKLPEAVRDAILLRSADLQTLQGELFMGRGNFLESKPRFEEALKQITSVIDSGSLQDQDFQEAKIVQAKSLSGVAMCDACTGHLSQAKKLLQQAIELLHEEPTTYLGTMIRTQIHGNMANLHELDGEKTLAIKHWEKAAGFIEEAANRIHENPSGKLDDTRGLEVVPNTEYFRFRSIIHHRRVKLLIETEDFQTAIGILSDLMKKEHGTLERFPNNNTFIQMYRETVTILHNILLNQKQYDQAVEVAERWTTLAQSMVDSPQASESHVELLIAAHHAAGHMFQRIDQIPEALDRYSKALDACHQAHVRKIRSVTVLDQKVELHLHQFELSVINLPLDQVQIYYERAVEASEELFAMDPNPEGPAANAMTHLKRGLDVMRSAGFNQAAGEWENRLKDKKLLP